MSSSPILRSAALQKSLARVPVRGATGGGFAAALAQAQARPVAHASTSGSVSTASGATSHPSLSPGVAPLRHSPLEKAAETTESVGSVPYQNEITAAASKYGVDPALLAGLVKQESNFNPAARSGVGAKGLTQLMDATARGLGVTDPFDPAQSLDAGAKFLSGLLRQFHGDQSLALAAYNAGPGAVQKYGGIPPYQETQRYVPKVLGLYEQFKRSGIFTQRL